MYLSRCVFMRNLGIESVERRVVRLPKLNNVTEYKTISNSQAINE